MGLFDLGDLIVLFIVVIAALVVRRGDRQARTMTGVQRFFEKKKIELEEFVDGHAERIQDLFTELESYDKTGREVLRRVEEDVRNIVSKSESLNEVKDLVLTFTAEKDRVFESLENLREDAKLLEETLKRTNKVQDKIEQVEKQALRLLNDMTESNDARLSETQAELLKVIQNESQTVQGQLQVQLETAHALQAQITGLVEQKEASLVSSLKAFVAEMQRIEGLYYEHLGAMEAQAKQMESEGLFQIKQNIEGQFSKLQGLTNELFEQESARFSQALDAQVHEFTAFAQQYRSMESELSSRFNDLAEGAMRMERERVGFEEKMHSLEQFMQDEFAQESQVLQQQVQRQARALAEELQGYAQSEIDGAKERTLVQVASLQEWHQQLSEQLTHTSDSVKSQNQEIHQRIGQMQETLERERVALAERIIGDHHVLNEAIENMQVDYRRWLVEAGQILEDKKEEIDRRLEGEQVGWDHAVVTLSENHQHWMSAFEAQWHDKMVQLEQRIAEEQERLHVLQHDLKQHLTAGHEETRLQVMTRFENERAVLMGDIQEMLGGLGHDLTMQVGELQVDFMAQLSKLEKLQDETVQRREALQAQTQELEQQWAQVQENTAAAMAQDALRLEGFVVERTEQNRQQITELAQRQMADLTELLEHKVASARVLLEQQQERTEHLGNDLVVKVAMLDQFYQQVKQMLVVQEEQAVVRTQAFEAQSEAMNQEVQAFLVASNEQGRREVLSQLEVMLAEVRQQTQAQLIGLQTNLDQELKAVDELKSRLSGVQSHLEQQHLQLQQSYALQQEEDKHLLETTKKQLTERFEEAMNQNISQTQEMSQAVQQQSQQMHFHLNQQYDALNLQFSQLISQSQQQMTELEQHLKEQAETLASVTESRVAQVDAQLSESQQKWQHIYDETQQRIDTESDQLAKQVVAFSHEQEQRLQSVRLDLEGKSAQALRASEEWLAGLDAVCTQLDGQAKAQLEQAMLNAESEREKWFNDYEAWKTATLARLDANKLDVGEVEQAFALRVEQLQAVLTERVSGSFNELNAMEEQWQSKFAQLDDQLSTALVAQEERWQSSSMNWQARFDELTAKISAQDDTLLAQLRGVSQRLEGEMTMVQSHLTQSSLAWQEQLAVAGQQIANEVAVIHSKTTEIENSWQARFAELSERVGVSIAEFDNKLNVNQLQNGECLTQLQDDVERRLTWTQGQLHEMEESWQLRKTQLDEATEQQKGKLDDELERHAAALWVRIAEMNAQLSLVSNDVQAQGSRLEQNFSEFLEGLRADIAGRQRELSVEHSQHQQENKAVYEQLMSQRADDLERLKNEAVELQEQWKAELENTSNNVQQRLALMQSGVDERLSQVDTQAELIEGAWSERYERYTEGLSQRLMTSEGEIEEALAQWQERLDNLQQSIDDRLGQAHELSDQVAGRWQQSFEQLQESMQERSAVTTAQMDQLERTWLERFQENQRLITQRLEASKEWADALEAGIQERYNGIEAQMGEKSGEITSLVQTVEEEWRGQFNVLNEHHRERLEALDTQMTANNVVLMEKTKSFQQLYKEQHELTEKLSAEQEEVLSIRFVQFRQEIEGQLEAAKAVSHEIEAGWLAQLAELDAHAAGRLTQAHTQGLVLNEQWSSRLEAMDTVLSVRLTEIEGKSQTILERFEAKDTELAELFEQRMSLAQEKANEVELAWQTTYAELQQRLTTAVQGQESEAVAQVLEVEAHFKTKLNQLNEEMVEWIESSERLNSEHKATVENLWASQLEELKNGLDLHAAEAETYTKTVEDSWKERFESFTRAVETRFGLAEEHIEQAIDATGAVWRDKMESAAEAVAHKVDAWVVEADEAITRSEQGFQLTEQAWQAKQEAMKEALIQHQKASEEELVKVHEQWNEQLAELKEALHEQLVQTTQLAHEVETSGQGRYQEVQSVLDRQHKDLINKSVGLDATSELIATRLAKLESSAFEEFSQQKENLRHQVAEKLQGLADAMRLEWEEQIDELKVTFMQKVAQTQEVSDQLDSTTAELTAEKALFMSLLDGLKSEAQTLFKNNAEQLDETFDALDGRLTHLHEQYEQRLAQGQQWVAAQDALMSEQSEVFAHTLVRLRDEFGGRSEQLVHAVVVDFATKQEALKEELCQLDALLAQTQAEIEHRGTQLQQQALDTLEDKRTLILTEQDELEEQLASLTAQVQGQTTQANELWYGFLQEFASEKERFNEQSAAEAGRLSEELQAIVQDFEQKRADLAALLGDKEQIGEASVQAFQERLTALEQVANHELSEQLALWQQRQGELAETAFTEYQQLQQLYAQRSDDVQQMWQVYDSTVQKHQQQLEDRVNDLVQSFEAKQDNLANIANEASVALEQQIQAQVAQKHEHWQQFYTQLNEQGLEHQHALECQVTDQLSQVEKYSAQLEELWQIFVQDLELKQQFSDKHVAQQVAKTDELWQKFGTSMSEKELQYGDKVEKRMALADTLWQEFATTLEAKERVFTDKFTQNVQSMSAEFVAIESDFEQRKEAMQEAFSMRLLSVDQGWQNFNERLSHKQDEFAQDYNARVEEASLSLEKLEEKFARQQGDFEVSFSERLNEAAQNLQRVQVEFDMKQQLFDEELASRVAIAGDALSKLEGEFALKRAELEMALADRVSAAGDDLDVMAQTLEARYGLFEQNFKDRLSMALKETESVQQELADKKVQMQSYLDLQVEQVQNELTALTQQLTQEQLERYKVLMSEHEAHYEQVNSTTRENFANLIDRVEQEKELLEEKFTVLEETFRGRLEQAISETEQLQTGLVERKNAMEALFVEKFDVAQTEINRLTAILDEQRVHLFDSITKRLLADETQVGERLEQLDQDMQRFGQTMQQQRQHVESENNLLMRSVEQFNQEIKALVVTREQAMAQNLDTSVAELEAQMARVMQERTQEVAQRSEALMMNLSEFEHNIDSKMKSYQAQFAHDVGEVERHVAGVQQDLAQQSQDLEQLRTVLTDKIVSIRESSLKELMRGQDELRQLIHSTIKQTGEDLSLDVMGTIEHRLNDYEEALKTKMRRLETFIHDVDNLEESLKASMGEVSVRVASEMEHFESTMRQRNEHEIDKARLSLDRIGAAINDLENNLQHTLGGATERVMNEMAIFESDIRSRHDQEIDRATITMNNVELAIVQLEERVNDMRRQALENVSGRLTEFETGFLEEVNRREEVLQGRVVEWQRAYDSKMESLGRKTQQERSQLEEQYSSEYKQRFTQISEHIEKEFGQFSKELMQFTKQIQSQTQAAQSDVLQLREQLQHRVGELTAQADEAMAEQFEVFQSKLGNDLTRTQEQTQASVVQVEARVQQHLQAIEQQLAGQVSSFDHSVKGRLMDVDERVQAQTLSIFAQMNNESEQLATFMKNHQQELVQARADYAMATQSLEQDLMAKHAHLQTNVQAMITSVQQEFAIERDLIIGSGVEDRRRILQELDDLSAQASLLSDGFEKRSEMVISRIREVSEQAGSDLARKTSSFGQELDEKLRDARLQTQNLAQQAHAVREQVLTAINDRGERLAERLTEIERRQQEIAKATPIFAQIDQLRNNLEGALIDLSERMAKVDARREEVVHLESQLNRAFKINESLAEKLNEMANARSRFDAVDERMVTVMSLYETIDRKVGQLDNVHKELDMVQRQLSQLKELESSMQGEFKRLEVQAGLALRASDTVQQDLEKVSELESSVAEAFAQFDTLRGVTVGIKEDLKAIEGQKAKIDYLLQFFEGSEEKVADMEGRVAKIDVMRDWIVDAEGRLDKLNRQAKSSLRTLGTVSGGMSDDLESSAGGKKPNKAIDKKEAIIRLYEEGWSVDQIAKQLKVPIGQVTLEIDRRGNQQ